MFKIYLELLRIKKWFEITNNYDKNIQIKKYIIYWNVLLFIFI